MRPDLMLIGFAGRAWSGKDTAARFLTDYAATDGIPWRRVGFADPLKEAAKIIFRLHEEQVNGELKETLDPRWDMTPRKILQRLGTEVGRQIREDVWIRNAELRVDELQSSGRHIVITDVRFLNEANAIRKWGGKVVRIQRDPSTSPYPVDPTHQSEIELNQIEYDAVIANNGTLDDLRAAVWSVVKLTFGKTVEW